MNVEKIRGGWFGSYWAGIDRRVASIAGYALWLVIWFYALSTRPLGEPDEGRYAEVAREMWASGDWLTPRLDGFDFFDKPPLHYWATAVAYALFGATPLGARLWCALTGLMSVVAVHWAGSRLFNRDVGTCAALVLSSSLLFTMGAHINTLDMGVCAFLTVAVALFLVAQFDASTIRHRFVLTLGMWLAVALALLSKGLIGVVLPGAAIVVYACWQRDFAILRRISPLTGAAILLLVCAPWFVWMCRHHAEFFDYFFIRQHVTRFLTNQDNRNKPFWFYFPVIVIGLFPWCLFVPIRHGAFTGIAKRASPVAFLLSWVGVVFVFFTVSHSKLPFYILPVFPALSLLLAVFLASLSVREFIVRLWLLATLLLCLCAFAHAAVPLMRPGAKSELVDHGLRILAATSLSILIATLVGIAFAHAGRRRPAVWIIALASLAGWQGALQSYSEDADFNSSMQAADVLRPFVDANTNVFTVNRNLRGLPFYLDRSVVIVGHADDDISPTLSSNPSDYIANVEQFEQRWKNEGDAVALVPAEDMRTLEESNIRYIILGKTSSLVAIGTGAPATIRDHDDDSSHRE
jgi:4-amino-4-deoxy-L-arabinose transferase-like glycosyltransferase